MPGHFDAVHVATFTTITPLPMTMAKELQEAKCAELDHEIRLQFKNKLAWFFVRGNEDVPEADKAPPPAASEDGTQAA